MSQFASEKRAPGICDKCGLRARLKRLRSEVILGKRVNNRVCQSCWDKDHPQNWLGTIRIVERTGLKNPRTDRPELADVRSLPGWNPVGNEAVRIRALVGRAHAHTE